MDTALLIITIGVLIAIAAEYDVCRSRRRHRAGKLPEDIQ